MKACLPTDGELKAMLAYLPAGVFADASLFHRAVYDYLTAQGWQCVKEYRVPDRGDGRRGRVDIVIGGLGLELDDAVPREKSRRKLASLPYGGFILMRRTRTVLRIPAAAGGLSPFIRRKGASETMLGGEKLL